MIARLTDMALICRLSSPSMRRCLAYCLAAGILLMSALVPVTVAVADGEDIEYSSDGGGTIENVDGLRITTLRGNVHVRQGESQLRGDTARLEQDPESGAILRVVVEGAPARFERRLSAGSDLLYGSSDRILYYTDGEGDTLQTIVEFIGRASFTSGRTALQCAEIRHFLESGTTESTGPCSGVLAPGTD